MTYQHQPLTDKDIEQEFEFPDTGANARSKYPNGHIVEFIDWAGEPDSIFIQKDSWAQALSEFERRISHTLIVNHRPGKMDFDY